MTFKLSKKGHDMLFDRTELKVEPDVVVDCVVLTKEEAIAVFKNEVGDDMTTEERTAFGYVVDKCLQVYVNHLYEEYKRIEEEEGE